MSRKSLKLVQYENPRFNSDRPVHSNDNPRLVYQVKQTTNVLSPAVGDWLTPDRVQDLINNEVQVTIVDL